MILYILAKGKMSVKTLDQAVFKLTETDADAPAAR